MEERQKRINGAREAEKLDEERGKGG